MVRGWRASRRWVFPAAEEGGPVTGGAFAWQTAPWAPLLSWQCPGHREGAVCVAVFSGAAASGPGDVWP